MHFGRYFWRYSAATDVGLQRSNNEDTFLSCPDLGLWVVADGMGGHAAGEVASAIVSETIKTKVYEGKRLTDAIQNSHRQVLAAAANGEGGQGMGSTVVAMHSHGKHYEIAWVGDSRAYLWSPQGQPPLRQMTTDHSYVQMLYQTGAISEEELDTHPEKNIITQCLGSLELDAVNVGHVEGEWKAGEKMLLCSDGLSDIVTRAEIAQVIAANSNAHQATKALINLALARGGKDNITVSMIEGPSSLLNFFHRFSAYLSKFFA